MKIRHFKKKKFKILTLHVHIPYEEGITRYLIKICQKCAYKAKTNHIHIYD